MREVSVQIREAASTLPLRLTVGHAVLVRVIEVRILEWEPKNPAFAGFFSSARHFNRDERFDVVYAPSALNACGKIYRDNCCTSTHVSYDSALTKRCNDW